VHSWGQQVPAPAVPAHEVAIVERTAARVGMMGTRVGSMGACTYCVSAQNGRCGEHGGAGGNNGYAVAVDGCCTCYTSAQSGCREVGGSGGAGGSTGAAALVCQHMRHGCCEVNGGGAGGLTNAAGSTCYASARGEVAVMRLAAAAWVEQ
jgi:hypothetical protein